MKKLNTLKVLISIFFLVKNLIESRSATVDVRSIRPIPELYSSAQTCQLARQRGSTERDGCFGVDPGFGLHARGTLDERCDGRDARPSADEDRARYPAR